LKHGNVLRVFLRRTVNFFVAYHCTGGSPYIWTGWPAFKRSQCRSACRQYHTPSKFSTGWVDREFNHNNRQRISISGSMGLPLLSNFDRSTPRVAGAPIIGGAFSGLINAAVSSILFCFSVILRSDVGQKNPASIEPTPHFLNPAPTAKRTRAFYSRSPP